MAAIMSLEGNSRTKKRDILSVENK